MTPSLLRPSTPWVKKNPFSEKKKLEGEPQMKDPSPWDGQMCNGWHIYREHQLVSFSDMSTFVTINTNNTNIRNNHIDSDGDSDDIMTSRKTIEPLRTTASIATTAVMEFQKHIKMPMVNNEG